MNDMITKDERILARINPEATKEMAVSTRVGGVEMRTLADIMEFAKSMAISDIGIRKHLRSNVGACFAICLQAFEWKLTPFAVANKSYLVNDQIAYEAQLLHAVILTRAPLAKRPKGEYSGEGPTRRLKILFHCTDGDILDYESPLFEKIQPKNSPLWKSDPDQQLWYYSVRAGCRKNFPDVLLGVYTEDEISEEIGRGPGYARDVTPVSSGLDAKLDKLAEQKPPKATEKAAAAAQAGADPETGEIPDKKAEASQGPAQTSDGGKKEPDPDRDGKDEDDEGEPEDPLLSEARSMTFNGSAKFRRWHGSLTVQQEAQLKPHYKALLESAKQVDKDAQKGGESNG